MGSVFTFVADEALRPADADACHHCGGSNQPIYDYFGEIIDPEQAADPQLARDHPDVSWLCAPCINGGNVRRTDTWSVEDTIPRFAENAEAAWADFNRLPNIPLFLQGKLDWPMCCGTWCEFTGSPENLDELITVQKTHQYWAGGPASARRDFATQGEPELLEEISLFRCTRCSQRFYTDQFT